MSEVKEIPGDDPAVLMHTPAQVTIREMKPADVAAGLRLCRLSRWNQIESDWFSFLQLSPGGCRIAEKDGRVVGTVATIRYENRFSWLGMLLVDPQERGIGIGTQLLHEGLILLRDQLCVRLDATPAGRLLYQKHGFVEEYTLHRMTRPSGTHHLPAPSEPMRRLNEDDLPAVFERDREVFGADRRNLLRILFQRSPECAWIAGEGRIKGYCLGRPGFLYRQLGPVIADNERIAADLISHCLLEGDGSFVIDASQHCAAWLHWLRVAGFSPERSFVRMYRGENRHHGAPEYQFGVLGPEFG